MSGQPLHIALVDDDRVYQFTTERMISQIDATARFQWFRDGEQALDYLRANERHPDILPDILILDINMPFMDGWQFLEAYREWKARSPKPIEIYLISSSSDERDYLRAQGISDVTEYLEKPITTDHIRTIITSFPRTG